MKRLILSITLCISACILLFTAIIFLMGALYLLFKESFTSPAVAAFLSGLVFIGGAAFLWLILWIIKHKTKVENKQSYNEILQNFSIRETVKAHPGESALIAILVGAVIGSSSSVRKKILSLIGLTIEELGSSPDTAHALAELLSKTLKDKTKSL